MSSEAIRVAITYLSHSGLSRLTVSPIAVFRALIAAVLSPLLLIAAKPAWAQTETALYSFRGSPDGARPVARLVLDPQGNLYGSTQNGGNTACPGGLGCGTVFELTPSGTETVLHSFIGGLDGFNPYAALVMDPRGNLYGTTGNGGNISDCNDGCGTVFKVTRSRKEKVLYRFSGGADGSSPFFGLVRKASGNLYGTTPNGGPANAGTVFKVTPSGTKTVLYNFTGMDGLSPSGDLIFDAQGNLYGTTSSGGAAAKGAVFKLTPKGLETVLHSFTGQKNGDGADPAAGLVMDGLGNLYGTTQYGGTRDKGVVFRIAPDGTEVVLYSFTGGADGAIPESSLVLDNQGDLYGTTFEGGVAGSGVVFEVTAAGTEKTIYSFTGGADGAHPMAALIQDSQGNLYGTTAQGGAYGNGVVFKVVP